MHLYRNAGSAYELWDATTTSAGGSYSFPAVLPGSYRVRVVNNSTHRVPSSRSGDDSSVFGVQTFRTNAASGVALAVTNEIGGANPAATADAASVTTDGAAFPGGALYWTPATVLAGVVGSVDFGFNFDTIVTTASSGLGSLQQFARNASRLSNSGLAQAGSRLSASGSTEALPAGTETSIFMIPAAALNGSGVAVISLPSNLLLEGGDTALDGTTQTVNLGNSNAVTLGTGGTVGVDATSLDKVAGPEVELRGATVQVTGDNVSLRGLAWVPDTTAIAVQAGADGALIERNVLGSGAAAWVSPTTPAAGDLVAVSAASGGLFQRNLVAFGTGRWRGGERIAGSLLRRARSGRPARLDAFRAFP